MQHSTHIFYSFLMEHLLSISLLAFILCNIIHLAAFLKNRTTFCFFQRFLIYSISHTGHNMVSRVIKLNKRWARSSGNKIIKHGLVPGKLFLANLLQRFPISEDTPLCLFLPAWLISYKVVQYGVLILVTELIKSLRTLTSIPKCLLWPV